MVHQTTGDQEDYNGADNALQHVEVQGRESSLFRSQEAYDRNDLKKEVSRIDDSTAFVIRAVDSLSKKEAFSLGIDMEDVINEVEREEQFIFSPIPEYLAKDWKRIKAGNPSFGRGDRNLVTTPNMNLDGKGRIDYKDECRVVIDPAVPLAMPYSKQRFDSTNMYKHNAQGHYHGLFYDDGEPIVFTPPEGNKRQELEKAAQENTMWKRKMARSERQEKDFTKKTMRVSEGFVPNCANVDDSAAKERLRQKKEEEQAKKNNRGITKGRRAESAQR